MGSSSFDTANGNASSEDPASAVTGMLTSATGTIDGTWAFGPNNTDGEIDWSGFQLDVAPPSAAVPEPSSLSLLAFGLAAIFLAARRRSAKRS
ncbi:MAG: PEP-CTERM sorting domain-containing protein [Bryobacteraceae bacterium]